MIGVTIDDVRVGDRAEIRRVASEADIAGFVDAVGDDNPIHSDAAFAAATRFKGRIAPGMAACMARRTRSSCAAASPRAIRMRMVAPDCAPNCPAFR